MKHNDCPRVRSFAEPAQAVKYAMHCDERLRSATGINESRRDRRELAIEDNNTIIIDYRLYGQSQQFTKQL